MQKFFSHSRKKSKFRFAKIFNFFVLNFFFSDWYYQNGNTLIKDYSIPGKRPSFQQTALFFSKRSKSRGKPTQRCGPCHVTTNKTMEKEVDAIFISNGPYLTWLHHGKLPTTRPQ